MSNLVKYSGYSLDAAEQDAGKVAALSGGQYLDLEVGDNIVRFIPMKLGMKSPFRVTAMHYVDAIPGLDKTLVFACPRVELKEACPVCQEADRLSKSPAPADRERAYRISAKLRVFAAVVDRTIADPEDGVRILGFGKTIHRDLKAMRNNPRLGGDFTDPTENGFDVVITRDGTGMQTKYNTSADRNSSPLASDADVINWIIENQPDLEKCVNAVVPEELLAAWEATVMRGGGNRRPPAQRVGSSLMQNRQPAQGAVIDAEGVEYDDDFNVVQR